MVPYPMADESWYRVTAPNVVITPISLFSASVNHRFPSGPVVMAQVSARPAPGTGKLVSVPLGVTRAM